MMELIAEYPDARFYCGDSLLNPMANDNTLVVSDPPKHLASRFWRALQGTDKYLIFAGLKRDSATVAEKLLSCDYHSKMEMRSGSRASLHTIGHYGSFFPQYVISTRPDPCISIIPIGMKMHDTDCEDCLLPEFIQWCIEMHENNQNDNIYDPFCGSGSTGLAALALGRKFVGVDLDRMRVIEASRKYGQELLNAN